MTKTHLYFEGFKPLMSLLTLKIKCHYSDMPHPQKANPSDSGIDVTLMKVLPKRENVFFFDTGVSIEPPQGYYVELFPRSSIYKTDFIMANSVGVIDYEYRGVIYMPMKYLGQGNGFEMAEKLIGQRVGQLVLKKLEPVQIQTVSELNDTTRGQGGFGSSGK